MDERAAHAQARLASAVVLHRHRGDDDAVRTLLADLDRDELAELAHTLAQLGAGAARLRWGDRTETVLADMIAVAQAGESS